MTVNEDGSALHESVWNDSPIELGRHDRFEFSHFASRLANFIGATPKGFGSTVFGLVGEWGSGKTSILNLLQVELEDSRDQHWAVTQFSPWATNDPDSMLVEFAQSIADAGSGDGQSDLKEKLLAFVQKASRFGAVLPGAVGETVGKASDLLSEWGTGKNWISVLKDLEKEVQKLDRKILVIVDDLDRLPPHDLVAVLKVVRLLGRLKDVHYLLVYDQRVLTRTLQSALPGSGTAWGGEYLEKFVQHAFTVPPPNEVQISNEIEQWLQAHSDFRDQLQQDPRMVALQSSVIKLLRTPRKLLRFFHRLDFYSHAADPMELRFDDLFFLTVIEVAAPTVYGNLWPLKMELISGNASYQSRLGGPEPKRALLAGDLTKAVRDDSAVSVQLILNGLFPAVKFKDDSYTAWSGARIKGISESDYFERYFVFNTLAGDVPDRTVSEAVEEASLGNAEPLTELFDGGGRLVSLVIAKGRQLSIEDQTNRACLVIEILKILARDRADSSRVFDPIVSALDWICELLDGLEPSEHRDVEIAIAGSTEEIQRNLGARIASNKHRLELGTWIESLAKMRLARLRRFLEGDSPEPVGYSLFDDYMFVCDAGMNNDLISAVSAHTGSEIDLTKRVIAMFLSVQTLAGPTYRDVALMFQGEAFRQFADGVGLNAGSIENIDAKVGDSGGLVRNLARDEVEPVDWLELAAELVE